MEIVACSDSVCDILLKGLVVLIVLVGVIVLLKSIVFYSAFYLMCQWFKLQLHHWNKPLVVVVLIVNSVIDWLLQNWKLTLFLTATRGTLAGITIKWDMPKARYFSLYTVSVGKGFGSKGKQHHKHTASEMQSHNKGSQQMHSKSWNISKSLQKGINNSMTTIDLCLPSTSWLWSVVR